MTKRFNEAEIAEVVIPLHRQMEQLEAENAALRPKAGSGVSTGRAVRADSANLKASSGTWNLDPLANWQGHKGERT